MNKSTLFKQAHKMTKLTIKPKYSPNQHMRRYKSQNISQRIEKRLIKESKKLDLNNRYELIAQAVEHIQRNK